MNYSLVVAITCLILGCGPDRMLLSETKLDTGLKARMESLATAEQTEHLTIQGKCKAVIDGLMRSDILGAGADISVMKGDLFDATISSDDLFDLAALEFVTQLKLLKK